MSNKIYIGIVMMCKSCGAVQGGNNHCIKCYAGNGHLLQIADTADAERVKVLDCALDIMIGKAIIMAPEEMPNREILDRAKRTVIEMAKDTLTERGGAK